MCRIGIFREVAFAEEEAEEAVYLLLATAAAATVEGRKKQQSLWNWWGNQEHAMERLTPSQIPEKLLCVCKRMMALG